LLIKHNYEWVLHLQLDSNSIICFQSLNESTQKIFASLLCISEQAA